MKILVTGGAGFIGSKLVDRLVQLNHDVITLDNLSKGKVEKVNKKAKFYKIDITQDNIEDIFVKENIDIVYHLAAQIDIQKSLDDPAFDLNNNTLGTIKILEACSKTGVKKIIFASSAAVYGRTVYLGIDELHAIRPISCYGISKYAAEQYINFFNEVYGLDFTILRYANIYGIPREGEGGVISMFLDRMSKGERPIIYGDGNSTRDFIYIEDVIDANIISISGGSKGVFNIGTGIRTSINELYSLINGFLNVNINPKYFPPRQGEIIHSYFNINKAKNLLNWSPKYSLKEGLNLEVEYYKRKYLKEGGL